MVHHFSSAIFRNELTSSELIIFVFLSHSKVTYCCISNTSGESVNGWKMANVSKI